MDDKLTIHSVSIQSFHNCACSTFAQLATSMDDANAFHVTQIYWAELS